MKLIYLVVSLLFAAAISAPGQSPTPQSSPTPAAESSELLQTIARMDAKMFDAFNVHNVDAIMSMFTEDLEFYHDTGGLTDFQQTKESFTKLFASSPDIRRDLVKDSLEVYPIKDYGAIEIGAHRFCHKEKGDGASPARTDCGTFKFAMIWRKTGDTWKISRVISYGH